MAQEIKRNIIYRRFIKETTNNAKRCDRMRLLGHLLITVRKMHSLRKYQGKSTMFLSEMRQTITEMM